MIIIKEYNERMWTLLTHNWKKMECEHKKIDIPLDAAYTTPGQHTVTPLIDEIETMLPLPDDFKSGCASRHE